MTIFRTYPRHLIQIKKTVTKKDIRVYCKKAGRFACLKVDLLYVVDRRRTAAVKLNAADVVILCITKLIDLQLSGSGRDLPVADEVCLAIK